MAKSLIVLPPDASPLALQAVLALDPMLVPIAIIDGLGAVVDMPPGLAAVAAALPDVLTVSDGPVPPDLPVIPELQPWLHAWNILVSPGYQSALASRPATWLPLGLSRAAIGVAPPPAIPTLTGDIAIGLVLVDGPSGGHAALSLIDHADIGLGVIHALEHLYRNAPRSTKLVFVVEQKWVKLTIDPATIPGVISHPTFQQQEDREKLWRDPALQALGYSAGFAGVDAYRAALRSRAWPAGAPQQAIIGFVTRYNTASNAYAAMGRWIVNLPQIDIYPGRNHIDRVFAHETCHLFGALDEYNGCNATLVSGPFGAFNGNCIHNPLATLGQAPCLMAGTSDDLCAWSKAHVGWSPIG